MRLPEQLVGTRPLEEFLVLLLRLLLTLQILARPDKQRTLNPASALGEGGHLGLGGLGVAQGVAGCKRDQIRGFDGARGDD